MKRRNAVPAGQGPVPGWKKKKLRAYRQGRKWLEMVAVVRRSRRQEQRQEERAHGRDEDQRRAA